MGKIRSRAMRYTGYTIATFYVAMGVALAATYIATASYTF